MSTYEREEPHTPPDNVHHGSSAGLAEAPAGARAAAPVQPSRQVLRLPVILSVHVASRRMELKQLLAIAPGSLITFSKPCDELLDLYVNNHHYARGEAVKVGENFGLKIDEIGPREETW